MSKYIYFIEAGDFVKIGVTNDVKRRAACISGYSPFETKLICYVRGDERDEAMVHKALKRFHVRREWFHLPDSIKGMLRKNSLKMAPLAPRYCPERTLAKENARRIGNGWPPKRALTGGELIEDPDEQAEYIAKLVDDGYLVNAAA